MNEKRIEKMADRIAADVAPEDVAIENVEQAIDSIIDSLLKIEDNLPKIKPENDAQKKALEKSNDLLETALAPYTSNLVKLMDVFSE